MKKYHSLAFDIGATSGRAVLGILEDGRFDMQEIHRFSNAIMELHGKYYWNVYRLYDELKESLRICADRNVQIDSIGIDTWGVDFGYIGADGTLLGLPRAYRDPYTEGAPEEYFKVLPREELYRRTGIQIMNFNTLFQLFRAKKEQFSPFEKAHGILFMPDLLAYLLTGKRVCEYTEASTSQLLNPETKTIDPDLLKAIGIDPALICPIVMPGTRIGELTDALAKETGIGKVPVVAVAGHDTASAVAAVPAENNGFAYLSSGTWSLMGIETEQPIISEASCNHNFTNEGGIEGSVRFLKNITGMWLLEQCRKEWEHEGTVLSYEQIVDMSNQAIPFCRFINPDDARFANPASMLEAIRAYCCETCQPIPETQADFIRCIFESLAFRYREVLEILQQIAPFAIRCLHVIGGGSKNNLLNQFTANAIGMPVIAGPSEATAIGNCMIQAKAAGLIADRWEMRRLIRSLVPLAHFSPEDAGRWEEAYLKYRSLTIKS